MNLANSHCSSSRCLIVRKTCLRVNSEEFEWPLEGSGHSSRHKPTRSGGKRKRQTTAWQIKLRVSSRKPPGRSEHLKNGYFLSWALELSLARLDLTALDRAREISALQKMVMIIIFKWSSSPLESTVRQVAGRPEWLVRSRPRPLMSQ